MNTVSDKYSSILKKTFGVAGATLISRILGLVRVKLEAYVLGGGEIASGWFLALAIPNLFRRILGEGALGTALMPLVAEAERTGGKTLVRRNLGIIFGFLSLILAAVVIVIGGGAWLLDCVFAPGSGTFWDVPRLRICLKLLPILMPYAFFICLVGAIGAVLNYAKVFILPAFGALLLNIFLISGLCFAAKYGFAKGRTAEFLPHLALLVVISGALQLILVSVLLKVYGRFPAFKLHNRNWPVVSELLHYAMPGMIGGAAVQISFLIDRAIALRINEYAVPALTFVDRIVDLPIGLFAISLNSVLMAWMSRSAAAGRTEEMMSDLHFALRHVFFCCVPMAAAVVGFHELALRVLCLGGNYTVRHLQEAHFVAIFYGCGIPLFCSLKAILPAFHARKKMHVTLYVSLAAIVTNIILNLILMHPLKQGGLALATVISSLLNNAVLLILLHREGLVVQWRMLLVSLIKTAATAALAALAAYAIWRSGVLPSGGLGTDLMTLLILLGITGAVYLALNLLLRSPEPREILSILHRRQSPDKE